MQTSKTAGPLRRTMKYRHCLPIVFTTFLILSCLGVKDGYCMQVDFINPGVSNASSETGEFWLIVSEFMRAAAKELEIDLDIHYAQREYVKMVELTKKVVQKESKPDYLILVNEKLIAQKLLKIVCKSNVKVLLILNDLTGQQKKQILSSDKLSKQLIGAIVPDNISAGYLIAKSLIDKGLEEKGSPLQMVAINGSRVTPASVDREKGLYKAITEHSGSVQLHQVTYGEWRKDRGYLQAKVLLRRYPDTDLIWAANDPMALGAVRAAREEGKTPGEDIFIAGLNWSTPGLSAVEDKALVSSVGGHFMVGGWALVMLHDFHKGCLEIKNKDRHIKIDVFRNIDQQRVADYKKYLGGRDW
ncbi:MAG: ABC transporter substrate-binding protein, partial [Thermodesulfobacteriota bacterium]